MKQKHHLKIHPQYFNAVKTNLKTFEIRKNDRHFQIGDLLVLKEFDGDKYTGNEIEVIVTYITDYAQIDNYVVMAIKFKSEGK